KGSPLDLRKVELGIKRSTAHAVNLRLKNELLFRGIYPMRSPEPIANGTPSPEKAKRLLGYAGKMAVAVRAYMSTPTR
ncbi:unnamed protein product, partial [Dovyalis caffra]